MDNQKTLFRAVPVLLLICTTGCVPGITWLPDSSGFVYAAGYDGKKLVHFNLATKKQRTIVSEENLQTDWPAVSPDGKSVAVATLSYDKDKRDTLQILIYDLNGKPRKQSKGFSLPQAGKIDNGRQPNGIELFWGPPENKIVVSISTNSTNVGIYDVMTDELKILRDASAMVFAGRTSRPDGKGIVVAKWRDKGAGISLVDWDGKERPIAMKSPIGDDAEKNDMLTWPAMFTSSWQGARAFLSSSKFRFEIDTDKLLCNIDTFKSGESNGDNFVRQQFTFTSSQIVVRVLAWSKQANQPGTKTLEIVDARQKKTQALMENEHEKIVALFPSPDGKLVAVRWRGVDKGEAQDMIWVIDRSGQVLAKVKILD